MFRGRVHNGPVRITVCLKQEVPGFESRPGIFLPGVCMITQCMCGYIGLLPHTKSMMVRLIDTSKLSLGTVAFMCIVICTLCLCVSLQ